jgi:hypothetical protein
LNLGLFLALVTAQIIVMVALIVLAIKLLTIIRAEGLTVIPPAVSAKVKRWLPRGGRGRDSQ